MVRAFGEESQVLERIGSADCATGGDFEGRGTVGDSVRGRGHTEVVGPCALYDHKVGVVLPQSSQLG
jgi:hypothetical protein